MQCVMDRTTSAKPDPTAILNACLESCLMVALITAIFVAFGEMAPIVAAAILIKTYKRLMAF